MYRKLASIAQQLRLPRVCILCKQFHHGPDAVCEICNKLFINIENPCKFCSRPLPDSNFLICGQCIKHRPYFDNTYAANKFEEPLRGLIHTFKYHGALYLRSFLSNLIIERLPNDALKTQCLIPVPIHTKRLQERGFNHTVELSKYIGIKLEINHEPNMCKKIRHTQPQAELSEKDRRKNLNKAFKIYKCKYSHVTLIDDLMTTGSTANELAMMLKQQGVSQVDVWCCARAVESKNKI